VVVGRIGGAQLESRCPSDSGATKFRIAETPARTVARIRLREWTITGAVEGGNLSSQQLIHWTVNNDELANIRSFDGRSLVSFGALSVGFPRTADGCGALARTLLRRLFVVPAKLHLAVDALALKPLFQHAQGLIDIVVADDDLHSDLAFTYLSDLSDTDAIMGCGMAS
jgi:hypothetical protein